ncbi:hypothetical protein OCU04_011107 [Sclerotinia nivalis]|uniref:Uncharacterized protein n=1 Tax=Sclerotinia nivalis TaxID=352851 RepID=A0A9X0AEL1_9HELO|nr:hypothetical protein OCU04_011107 [Sclerotinia nivalis]
MRISIDICQVHSSMLRSSDDVNKSGVDLSGRFSSLYSTLTPRPGLSIGRKDTTIAGSLTGFVKHRNDIYSVTCRYVAFPASQSEGYKYKDGEDKLMMSMPADNDHKATKAQINDTYSEYYIQLRHSQTKQAMATDRDYSYQMLQLQHIQEIYADQLRHVEEYKTDAGYIYAAPKAWYKSSTYKGVLDWVLIRNECTNPKNQIKPVDFCPANPIREFIDNFPKNNDWTDKEREALVEKFKALNGTEPLNIKHPNSFSEPHNKTVYFKSPSRTSNWRACQMSCIKSVVYKDGHSPSNEHVFVGRGVQDHVSYKDDSGALIYDIDIIPGPNGARNTAALLPLALIWSGDGSGDIVSGFEDVTFATPVGAVLKDIESYMGWEEGSLRFC